MVQSLLLVGRYSSFYNTTEVNIQSNHGKGWGVFKVILSAFMLNALLIGNSYATLTPIGSAQYDSNFDGIRETYNIIYEDKGPFGPVIWLDFTKMLPGNTTTFAAWNMDAYKLWAKELNNNGALIYIIDSKFNIALEGVWRLPKSTVTTALLAYDGSSSYGFNVTSSELGYLYYHDLGNKGMYDINGNYLSPSPLQQGPFNNIKNYFYWSETTYPDSYERAYNFSFNYPGWRDGFQGIPIVDPSKGWTGYGMAVMSTGELQIVDSPSTPSVPEPSTFALFGVGFAGIGIRNHLRRKK